MFNSKYSNVLTVLLVIVIIVIVGLIAFLGFDMYRKYYIDKEAEDFMSKYEEQLGNVTIDEDKNEKEDDVIGENATNTGNTTIIDPGNQTNTNTNSNSSGSSGNTTTYKGFNVLGTIEIPRTGIKYPVLDKVTIKSIEVSVAYYYGPGLNEVGNTVIVGHNYRNGAFFGKNKKLAKGDSIYITDNSGKKIKYTIYDIYTTKETDAAYITRETNGKREISLSTCTDDSKGRLIVCARES